MRKKLIQNRTDIRLIQEDLDDPWRMLVANILLNRTRGDTVKGMLDDLFERWPDPQAMSLATEAEIAAAIRTVGFQNRKARMLIRMSEDYLRREPLSKTFGVGRYASDSWAIFVEGREDVEPEDRALRAYLDERRRGGQGR